MKDCAAMSDRCLYETAFKFLKPKVKVANCTVQRLPGLPKLPFQMNVINKSTFFKAYLTGKFDGLLHITTKGLNAINQDFLLRVQGHLWAEINLKTERSLIGFKQTIPYDISDRGVRVDTALKKVAMKELAQSIDLNPGDIGCIVAMLEFFMSSEFRMKREEYKAEHQKIMSDHNKRIAHENEKRRLKSIADAAVSAASAAVGSSSGGGTVTVTVAISTPPPTPPPAPTPMPPPPPPPPPPLVSIGVPVGAPVHTVKPLAAEAASTAAAAAEIAVERKTYTTPTVGVNSDTDDLVDLAAPAPAPTPTPVPMPVPVFEHKKRQQQSTAGGAPSTKKVKKATGPVVLEGEITFEFLAAKFDNIRSMVAQNYALYFKDGVNKATIDVVQGFEFYAEKRKGGDSAGNTDPYCRIVPNSRAHRIATAAKITTAAKAPPRFRSVGNRAKGTGDLVKFWTSVEASAVDLASIV